MYCAAMSGEASLREMVLNGLLGRAFARGFARVTESEVKITCAICHSWAGFGQRIRG